jgi:hypothetical protein
MHTFSVVIDEGAVGRNDVLVPFMGTLEVQVVCLGVSVVSSGDVVVSAFGGGRATGVGELPAGILVLAGRGRAGNI